MHSHEQVSPRQQRKQWLQIKCSVFNKFSLLSVCSHTVHDPHLCSSSMLLNLRPRLGGGIFSPWHAFSLPVFRLRFNVVRVLLIPGLQSCDVHLFCRLFLKRHGNIIMGLWKRTSLLKSTRKISCYLSRLTQEVIQYHRNWSLPSKYIYMKLLDTWN